jgi:hypothetical protein
VVSDYELEGRSKGRARVFFYWVKQSIRKRRGLCSRHVLASSYMERGKGEVEEKTQRVALRRNRPVKAFRGLLSNFPVIGPNAVP